MSAGAHRLSHLPVTGGCRSLVRGCDGARRAGVEQPPSPRSRVVVCPTPRCIVERPATVRSGRVVPQRGRRGRHVALEAVEVRRARERGRRRSPLRRKDGGTHSARHLPVPPRRGGNAHARGGADEQRASPPLILVYVHSLASFRHRDVGLDDVWQLCGSYGLILIYVHSVLHVVGSVGIPHHRKKANQQQFVRRPEGHRCSFVGRDRGGDGCYCREPEGVPPR